MFLVLWLFACLVAATPVPHAKRTNVPSGWSRVRQHSPDAFLPLRFGLTQPNTDMATLDSLLHTVSHPDSPSYGQHWSAGRVASHFAASNESIFTVVAWLASSGFDANRISVNKRSGWVALRNATVAEAESLLETEYHVFVHTCEEYHLPAHVAPHVQLITPSVDFDAVLRVRSPHMSIDIGQPGAGTVFPHRTQAVDALFPGTEHCDSQITPACLRALYNFTYTPTLTNGENPFAIVEYTPQAYVPSDLDHFAANFSPALVGVRPAFVSIDGGSIDGAAFGASGFDYNGESNLDLEYAMTFVSGAVTLYQVGDFQMGASFNNLLDALDGSYCSFEGGDDPQDDGIYPDTLDGGYQGDDCGTVKPANVISTSYGYNEADLSAAYTARQCAEYAKLGLMGVTVLYSSGDNGVAGNGALCLTSDGEQTPSGKIFNPSFPSTCPFVTSVGATQINPGKTVADPESACQQVISSGGGFSNYFALPDLSANGANYATAIEGGFYLVYGTSASAPVVASMLAMINDARLAAGKSTIGFINPAIYTPAFEGAFHDIVAGSNPGCGTRGFAAAEGYDPVTGLGTPQFDKLLELWMDLP